MVETIRGADFVLLVTEPTPFGLHDLKQVAEIADELGIPTGVVINRDGIGNNAVEVYCQESGLPILMRIPMDRGIAEGIAQGRPLVETRPEMGQSFQEMLGEIIQRAVDKTPDEIRRREMRKEDILASSSLHSILLVAQYYPGIFRLQNAWAKSAALDRMGHLVISVVFGFAPMFIFRKRGGVAKGNSYVKTTQLVDSSLYAIVRHPQYVAGMLFSLAMMFLAQYWVIFLMGAVSMTLFYIDTQAADQEGIEKFGGGVLRVYAACSTGEFPAWHPSELFKREAIRTQ